jgi:plastocyanin
MEYDTIFYICGAALAVAAVVTSFIGLKSGKFPGRATPVVILAFVALIGVTTTYAVLNGQHEEEARAEELEKAGEEFEKAEEEPVGGEKEAAGAAETGGAATGKEAAGEKAPVSGPGGTLQLAASPTAIAFDKTKLDSEAGEVTIEFTNPSALEHDVAIEKDGKEIAGTELIAEGKTSVTTDLGPGAYTFLCTVPGHAEAGMEGTLTVK